MATSTTFLKLVKAALGERYSVATTNNNLDLIDVFAASSKIDIATAKGATTNATYGLATSDFYRIRMGPTFGLIVAVARLEIKVAVPSVPTVSPVNAGMCAPPGFKFKTNQPFMDCIASGNGQNYAVQLNLEASGNLVVRKAPSGPSALAANTIAVGIWVGEWNGSTSD